MVWGHQFSLKTILVVLYIFYLDICRRIVTQVRYFVSLDNNPLYPTLTVAPSNNDVADASVSLFGYQPEFYQGTQLLLYDSCYRVTVYNNIDPVNTADVLDIIEGTWSGDFSKNI